MNMKHLYTELEPLINSGSVTDESISDNSVIEIYFDNTDVYLKTISQNGNTVTFTTDGNIEGVNVCVVVNNLTDVDISSMTQEIVQNTYDIEDIFTSISGINETLTTHGTSITTLQNNKQNTLIEGDNIELTPQSDGTVKISASGGGEGVSNPFGTYQDFIDQRDALPVGSAFDTILEEDTRLYAYVDVTITAIGFDYTVDYPEGFNANNCYVVSMMNHAVGTSNRWDYYPNHNITSGVLVSLRQNNIVFYSSNNASANNVFRAYLRRI